MNGIESLSYLIKNPVDISFIVISLVFIARGLWRGMTREVFGLIGIVGGIFLGLKISPMAVSYISKHFELAESYSYAGVFGAIFVTVCLIMSIAARIVQKILKAADLSLLDRIAGGAIGAGKSFAIALLLVGTVDAISLPIDSLPQIQESFVVKMARSTWPYVAPYIHIIDLKNDSAVSGDINSSEIGH